MSNEVPKKPRNRSAGASIDEDTYEKVKAKAEKEGRTLGAIIRSFLLGWADDEYPTPEVRPDEDKRYRGRKK